MPERWNNTRIAGHLHRTVLGGRGFERRGTASVRIDGGLVRRLRLYSLPDETVQVMATVEPAGLPPPVTRSRADRLGGTPRGRFHPRPRSTDPLPEALVADVAGPAADFLLHPRDLGDLTVWAQEIYLDRGWGRFGRVEPGGTGPLQVAAYAAAMAGDRELTEFLARRVANEEGSEHYLADFERELAALVTGRGRTDAPPGRA